MDLRAGLDESDGDLCALIPDRQMQRRALIRALCLDIRSMLDLHSEMSAILEEAK